MRKFFTFLVFCLSLTVMASEQLSSVEQSGNWIYLYNAQGKRYKTLSVSSVGQIVGYSSSFFVSVSGNWVYLFDADGKRYKTLSKSSIGTVTGVAGDTFTSRSGNWVYTWDRNGKKINTRSAR